MGHRMWKSQLICAFGSLKAVTPSNDIVNIHDKEQQTKTKTRTERENDRGFRFWAVARAHRIDIH